MDNTRKTRADYQSKIKADEWIVLELKSTETKKIKSNAKALKQNKNIAEMT